MMTRLRRRNMNDPKSPNVPSELVKIKGFEASGGLQLISSYGENGFRISEERYSGAIMLSPRQTLSWQPPENPSHLTTDDILPYFGEGSPPLFILGLGQAPMAPMNNLAASLKVAGISLELMSTAAACRTWNVLMIEGRNAAAGLYAIA